MQLRVDQPDWLWGLVLIVPMAWVVARWCRTMSLPRRWLAIALRTALVVLALLMLAGVTAVRKTDKLAVVALLDVSGSVLGYAKEGAVLEGSIPVRNSTSGAGGGERVITPTEAAREWLKAATRGRGAEDLIGIVAFDSAAHVVAPPRPPPAVGAMGGATGGDVLDRSFDLPRGEGTDLAAAIRQALQLFPPDAARRLLVISDGVVTAGDAAAAARLLTPSANAAASASKPDAGGVAESASPAASSPARSADRVAIDVLPIEYAVRSEVSVEAVDAPTRAPAGAVINVRVVLQSAATARGRLRLSREGEAIAIGPGGADSLPVELQPGQNSFTLPVTLGPTSVHRFRATFEPEPSSGNSGDSGTRSAPPTDTVSANNSGETVTVTPGRGSVLIVDGVGRGDPSGAGSVLYRTLKESAVGLDVQIVSAEGFPTDMLKLQSFDLVVLQNVSADALGEANQDRLVRAVTELGIGLVMVGGPESFAAGGYRGSRLEPILPVKLELPDRLVVPATAVVFVLDCSGSMGWRVMGSSRTQQDIANEGAAMAVRSMDKSDLVGVIKFDNRPQVLVPLSKNTDAAGTAQKILDISPEGGTNMPPALEEAHRQLKKVDAKVKHVIALTDGVSRDRGKLNDLARKLARDGIKLTAIAVGDGADTDGLAAMVDAANDEATKMAGPGQKNSGTPTTGAADKSGDAASGEPANSSGAGGQYYRVVDPNVLPRVFLRAVRVVRTPLVREEPFVPLVLDAASPLLSGVLKESSGQSGVPQLRGIALTQPRTDVTVSQPLMTPTGEPVLAHWQAGLGQVAAFTSDAHDKWAADWLPWPGYRALWSRVVSQISRPPSQRAAELSLEPIGDRVRVRVEASDDSGKPQDGLSIPAAIYAPSGDRTDVRLLQVGPGTYEAELPATGSGTYVVTATPKQGNKALAPVVGGFARQLGEEYRTLRSDRAALEALAAATGGRVLSWNDPAKARFFDREQTQPRESRTPLWPHLLPWLIVLALMDVASRRVAWDRLISRRFGTGLARHAAQMVRDRGATAAASVGQLRTAGEAVAARETATSELTGQPAPTLSTEDARRIVQERRKERAAAQRQGRGADKAVGKPPSSGTQPPSRPAEHSSDDRPPAEGSEGGLAAAKRRARERFEKDPG